MGREGKLLGGEDGIQGGSMSLLVGEMKGLGVVRSD